MTTHRPKTDEPRVNQQINAQTIRLIDAAGQMVGVVSLSEGLKLADQSGLDLVEVSPTASPPVCKIIDYGKYKYALQKKASEARKKQKVIDIKEIKLRPTIDKHDLDIKIRNAHKFLEEGDKVKVTLRFRGREMSHREIAFELMQQVQERLDELAKVELSPRVEGRQMIMMLVPVK